MADLSRLNETDLENLERREISGPKIVGALCREIRDLRLDHEEIEVLKEKIRDLEADLAINHETQKDPDEGTWG